MVSPHSNNDIQIMKFYIYFKHVKVNLKIVKSYLLKNIYIFCNKILNNANLCQPDGCESVNIVDYV